MVEEVDAAREVVAETHYPLQLSGGRGRIDWIQRCAVSARTCNIGKVAQFEDAQVKELLQTAERSVLKTDCFLAGFRPSRRDLNGMFNDGYSLVCRSIDLGLLREVT